MGSRSAHVTCRLVYAGADAKSRERHARIADAALSMDGELSGRWMAWNPEAVANLLPCGLSNVAVTIAVAPSDADTLAVVDDQTRFYRSSDGGETWPGPG